MPVEQRRNCNEDTEMRFFFVCLGLLWRTLPTWANVEKTVFVTPSVVSKTTHIDLTALDFDVLSPNKKVIHRRLPATFPNSTNPLGTTTWLLLENLVGQRRYEVRVCWAATVSLKLFIGLFPIFFSWFRTKKFFFLKYTCSFHDPLPHILEN